jgi:C4-dicarboxylate transporter DctM subunit
MGSCVVYLPLLVLPIAFSLATAGIVGIYLLGGDWTVVLRIPGTTPFGVTAEHILTTIPMFIFMAYFSASGGPAQAGRGGLGEEHGGHPP